MNRADLGFIAVGGVAGAIVRRLLTETEQTGSGWFAYAPNPSGANVLRRGELSVLSPTLWTNIAGCLLLGGLTVLLARTATGSSRRLLVALSTGFCGSLTTFSTFAVEAVQRLRGTPPIPEWARDATTPVITEGGLAAGLGYVLVSVAGGALAFALGRILVQQVTP